MTDPVKAAAREVLYRLAPDRWVERELGTRCDPWQVKLLRAPPGAQVVALTARQAGKTQAAAWAAAHVATFRPGSLSVFAAPSQRQSGEAIRRVKAALDAAGVGLRASNIFSLETDGGSRVLALPGSDDSVRGLSVDGLIVADEAARLSADLISALRPMRARHPEARFVMLSTAWSRMDPFWQVWESDDPSWLRLRATADVNTQRYSEAFLESERRALGETAFRREYLGEPIGEGASPFDWSLFDKATARHAPLNPPGAAFDGDDGEPEQVLPSPFARLQPVGA